MAKKDRENSSTSLSRSAWLAHVKASCQSGLSRAEYCRRHNISYHALTYWCKKTAQQHISVQPGSVNLVPVSLPVVQRSPALREPSGVHIRLAGNITIDVAVDFSQDTLKKVLIVLEGQS